MTLFCRVIFFLIVSISLKFLKDTFYPTNALVFIDHGIYIVWLRFDSQQNPLTLKILSHQVPLTQYLTKPEEVILCLKS